MDVLLFVVGGSIILAFSIASIVACANTGRMLREHQTAYLEAKECLPIMQKTLGEQNALVEVCKGAIKENRNELDALKQRVARLDEDAASSSKILFERVKELQERTKELESRVEKLDVGAVEGYARSIDAALTDRSRELAALRKELYDLKKHIESGVKVGSDKTDRGERVWICISNKYYAEEERIGDSLEQEADQENGGQE